MNDKRIHHCELLVEELFIKCGEAKGWLKV